MMIKTNLYRQGIHISPEGDERRRTGANGGDDAGFSHRPPVLHSQQVQLAAHHRAGGEFFVGKLRVPVNFPPYPPHPRCRLRFISQTHDAILQTAVHGSEGQFRRFPGAEAKRKE